MSQTERPHPHTVVPGFESIGLASSAPRVIVSLPLFINAFAKCREFGRSSTYAPFAKNQGEFWAFNISTDTIDDHYCATEALFVLWTPSGEGLVSRVDYVRLNQIYDRRGSA